MLKGSDTLAKLRLAAEPFGDFGVGKVKDSSTIENSRRSDRSRRSGTALSNLKGSLAA
jgi:hypothetical protein